MEATYDILMDAADILEATGEPQAKLRAIQLRSIARDFQEKGG